MNTRSNAEKESLLSTVAPAKAIIKLAIPATLAGRQLGAGEKDKANQTVTTIGASKIGLLLSVIRQGLLYVPFILCLPGVIGVRGIYFAQPCADILTILVCLLLVRPMKRIASQRMMLK